MAVTVACGLQVHLELARRFVIDLELARGVPVGLALRKREVPLEDLCGCGVGVEVGIVTLGCGALRLG